MSQREIHHAKPRLMERFAWPAWLTSTVVHAALFVALGLTLERLPKFAGNPTADATVVSLTSAESESLGSLEEPAGGATSTGESQAAESQPPPESIATAVAAIPTPELSSATADEAGRGDDLFAEPAGLVPSEAIGDGTGTATGSGTGAGSGRGGRPSLQAVLGKTTTTVFGLRAEGQKFVYVFDRSASMSLHDGAPLAAAKAQLLSSLRDLNRINLFQIIFYNDRVTLFDNSGRLIFGADDQKRLAENFVRSISADGATQHEDALTAALRMGPDVIFFLTDADHPQLSDAQLAKLERLNSGSAQIHTIEFGYGPSYGPQNFLQKLAVLNGGQYAYVDVTQLLKAQY
jgi:hypothetical protein